VRWGILVKRDNKDESGLVVNSILSGKIKTRSSVSPITLRILAINVLALALLVVGLLYVGQYRQGLIDSEVAALNVEAELFAAALGETAVGKINSNKTLIIEDVNQIVRRMVTTTGTVAQLFLPNGNLLIDSRLFTGRSSIVQVRELPPPNVENTIFETLLELFSDFLRRILGDTERVADLSIARNIALSGDQGVAINTLSDGRLSLTVAVPVQRYKRVLAALLLTKNSSKVNDAVFQVRLDILKVFCVVLLVTILLSIYLASSIARPLKKLALATEEIRKGRSRHYEITNILNRKDEIGELGNMLNDMTEALWLRMEAIERFAADVAHEIKNPLTSLKSAVETVVSVDEVNQKKELMAIILDDIERLDRLISDISDASRLDAELSRAKMVPVELLKLLKTLLVYYDAAKENYSIRLKLIAEVQGPIIVQGIEDRLVQVFRNLISNAISFSLDNGLIRLRVLIENGDVMVFVEDQGPGLQPGTEENIFNRFYRERPENEKFGIHSGLGLSISRQIIKVHGGSIWAENMRDENGKINGACFIVKLPKNE